MFIHKLVILFLFGFQSLSAPIGAPLVEPPVIRERWTVINNDAMRSPAIGLNMFSDALFVGIVKYTDNETIWRGVLAGEPIGFWVVVMNGNHWYIEVNSAQYGHYISYWFEGLYRIAEIQ
jgi:hypothetical protein